MSLGLVFVGAFFGGSPRRGSCSDVPFGLGPSRGRLLSCRLTLLGCFGMDSSQPRRIAASVPCRPQSRRFDRGAGKGCSPSLLSRGSAMGPAWITGREVSPRPLVGVVLFAFEDVHVVTRE